MAHINLLPWREELRKQQKQQFAAISLMVVVLAALVALYAHLHIGALIDQQNARNEYLKVETAELDKRIKEIQDLEDTKAKLQARINIIQQLQRSRPGIVHLFDELVRTLPEGVFLSGVTQKESNVTLTGVAQSNARVSAYMRNVESSKWVGGPNLNVIQSKQRETEARSNDFTLNIRQTGSGQEEAVQEAPEAGAKAPAKGRARTRARPKAGGA